MISARIDVKKIDKKRLYVGEKGTYLDVILIPTPNGQYGDYMVCESMTKEERAAGKKGMILGNAKNIGSQTTSQPQHQSDGPTDDLPF